MELGGPAGQRHGRTGHGLDAASRGPLEGRRGAVEHRGQVLHAGVDGWQPSMQKGVTTSKIAVLLQQGMGVSCVVSEMHKYKDAVLFGLTMAWGVEVQSFDLLPEHSHVNFTMLRVLTDVEGEAMSPQRGTQVGDQQYTGKIPRGRHRPAGTKVPMQEDNADRKEDEVGEEGDEARVTHRVLTAKLAKMMRKRPGAPRWTQKLCRMLDYWLTDED